MDNKRISDLPFDESAFNNAKVIHELALKHGGYKSEMKFDQKPLTRRNRSRKIIYLTLILENSNSNWKNIPKIIDLEKYST